MRRILSLILIAILLFTGCTAPQGSEDGGTAAGTTPQPAQDSGTTAGTTPQVSQDNGTAADPVSYLLAQPDYPDFPDRPQPPQDWDDWDGWGSYYGALSRYQADVSALRSGCDPAQVRGSQVLLDFAVRSAPLALAGHEGENAVYSPLSLWSALAMQAQCADGDTRRQLLDALGASDIDVLRDLVRQVWLCLYTDDGQDALVLGNSIWLNNALEGTCVQDTLDLLARDYFSTVGSIPMGTPEADQAVTDWIAAQTHGLIGGDGPAVETDGESLALLASSLYYRAGWEDEFYEGNTHEDTFTAAHGQQSQIDFMHTTRDGLFLLRDGYQAAYLPTRLGEMVFVLPDEGVAPESLLQDPAFLTGLEFTDGRREDAGPAVAAHWGEIRWSVPKFDVDSGLDLLDALSALGVRDLLDPERSDLSPLTSIPAYLGAALQLARVKVDEQGAEAAAVTILDMTPGAALPPEDPEICVMDLDRPFLFVVRSWDLPLFVGIVNCP